MERRDFISLILGALAAPSVAKVSDNDIPDPWLQKHTVRPVRQSYKEMRSIGIKVKSMHIDIVDLDKIPESWRDIHADFMIGATLRTHSDIPDDAIIDTIELNVETLTSSNVSLRSRRDSGSVDAILWATMENGADPVIMPLGWAGFFETEMLSGLPVSSPDVVVSWPKDAERIFKV